MKEEKTYTKDTIVNGVPLGDIWSLYESVAAFIAPRMEAFVKCAGGGPVRYTGKKWKKMQKKMAFAWKHISQNTDTNTLSKKQLKKIKEGFVLFWQNFFDLWY